MLERLEWISAARQPLPPSADDDVQMDDDELRSTVSRSEVDPQFATSSDQVGLVGSSEPLRPFGVHKLSGISSHHDDPYENTGDYLDARRRSFKPSPGSQQRLAEVPTSIDSASVNQEIAHPYESVYRPQASIDGSINYYPTGTSNPGHNDKAHQYQQEHSSGYYQQAQSTIPIPYPPGQSTHDIYYQPGVNAQWTPGHHHPGSDFYRSSSWPPHLISYSNPPMFSIPSNNSGQRQVMVPQQNPIMSLRRSGEDRIALTDVMNEGLDHLIGRDDPMFLNYTGPAISPLPKVSHNRPPGPVTARRNPLGQCISIDTNPSISIFSSLLHSTTPPEPWIPLSFLEEDKLQVQIPDVDATDLDMRSRLWLLVRLLKFGTQFSGRKLDALLRGDQSGIVMNRAFVCGAQWFGIVPYAGVDATPAMVCFYARRVQTAWESLAELFRGDDYRASLQAAVFVASSHAYMCMPQTALLYIQKSCDFIKAGDLQFVPTCGRPPEFSEDLHETLAALSQTIYWANYFFLMRGGPEPRATAKLEMEFRRELPQTYPILFKICPLTMRTQGILLVRDMILLTGVLPANSVELGLWRQSCDRILESLEVFSQNLLDNVKIFREHGDKSGVDVIGSSCIACLAHLAVLYEVISRADSVAKVGMGNRCDSALQILGTLTSELHFDEYTYLDLLLGDSWKKSLTVFDARIESLPFEESEQLRHFRKVVGEVYSDFRARLPDCEPPIIYSLSMGVDGTTEESTYPSLMSAEVRMKFGI
ncbi:hypothetical protein BDM02DRAFT_3193922 [Thelephora ganbajun]|uniref:Uncharacterized protein n=1 Tax=Thelephora ganbajun TaxID=370292 RepID=A0ACB6YYE9_THEGA|nr:hypothetical protein BDM02DRAFT_3193922 [Thelephora ganbajun]